MCVFGIQKTSWEAGPSVDYAGPAGTEPLSVRASPRGGGTRVPQGPGFSKHSAQPPVLEPGVTIELMGPASRCHGAPSGGSGGTVSRRFQLPDAPARLGSRPLLHVQSHQWRVKSEASSHCHLSSHLRTLW